MDRIKKNKLVSEIKDYISKLDLNIELKTNFNFRIFHQNSCSFLFPFNSKLMCNSFLYNSENSLWSISNLSTSDSEISFSLLHISSNSYLSVTLEDFSLFLHQTESPTTFYCDKNCFNTEILVYFRKDSQKFYLNALWSCSELDFDDSDVSQHDYVHNQDIAMSIEENKENMESLKWKFLVDN